MLLSRASRIPEYKELVARVKTQVISSEEYFGKGYQDIQHRVPGIENTESELGWSPQITMEVAIDHILEAYKDRMAEASALLS